MSEAEQLALELQQLRDAVLAMAVALGAALPSTPDVTRTLSILADTVGPLDEYRGQ